MDPLLVDVVHFYPQENAQTHNTIKYESVNEENPTTAIVRRGTPFNGVVRFTRPFDEENDMIQLLFTLGDKPQMDTQGSVFLRRDAVHDKHAWTAKILDVQEGTVSFEVNISLQY
ncbi:annulin-like [Ostrinia furnacalis]|uniref:annulin-like n=1 Tax=Ostrinia furnacalis TaxID=93504 RepID=UPI00103A2342|nr:annulin-like [Ostrinia furnacalis]